MVINTNEGGVSGVVISPENEDGLIEVETDAPINGKMVNLFTRDELDELTQKEQGDENTSDEVDIENFQPTGKSILGNLYNQFKGKSKAAINFLLKRKEGNAVAALHHKDVGDIDLWYGNDKAGLKKIAEKHPEVLEDLQGIIDGMRVVQASENRVILESDTHKAVISKMLGNEKTDNWLLSAYEKKDISGGSSDIGPEPEGKQNGTAPLLNELSAGKDSENSDTNQTNNQENADDVLVERLSNHTPESAQGFINNNVESLNKELAKAKKKKSKATDFDEYERETAENEAEVQRLEAELERWNTIQQRVNDIANEKKAAAQAEARDQRKQSVANTQGDSSEEVSNSNESNEGDGPKEKLATDIREQQRREQILPNLGGKYSLSQEKANNGEVFYQNENGNTTLAIIPDEIFDRLGIKPIPFKLTETMGWHVFDHHKKEAKFNNIGDAIDFVLSIINNVDHVRLGRDNTYIFSVENGRSRVGKRAVTIMINSETGEFMGIRTSGYETLGKLIERPLLWERGADFVPEDVATPTITTIESQQGDETSSRAKSQSNDVSADKDKTSSANKQENEEKSVIQGLENYTEDELLDAIRSDIEAKLEEAGISDVTIKGMALNGSRLRGDAKADSDLDVVVEYEGDMSEDGLFNILNEEPITIEGVKVDINPITRGKSGTLEEYMKRSRAYDEEQKSKAAAVERRKAESIQQNGNDAQSDAEGEGEVETYHIGDQFEIIDKDGNPNLCRITGIDADGNIEIVAGGLGHSYKESVTPSTLDMYQERKLDYDTRNEMRYFISNVVDDDDVTFVNKITTEELRKFKHLVDVWDELPDGTKDKKESYDEVEDYITQLRKAYPVEDNTAPNKYDEYRGEVEKEIADIENRLDPDNSEKNDKLIQQISDIMADAEDMLENDTLSEDERTRYQARYDAADKWLDDNVRGGGVSNAVQSGRKTAETETNTLDPRTMSDEEKERRGEMLRTTDVTDVESGQIVSKKGVSARKAAENWWVKHVGAPLLYKTEVGEVVINLSSVDDSLAHGYSQTKLDAITSLPDGFNNSVYLGSMEDANRRATIDHYFAYPINYNGKRCYVFCRALQDRNTNRLYVHEVFVADNIKKGNTLQTAASKPHGGIALYRDILANVLDSGSKDSELSDNEQEKGEKTYDFTHETEDEWREFEKGVKDMSDEELLDVIRAQGFDENKASHMSVYDEYDARHKEEYSSLFDTYMDGLNDGSVGKDEVEDMLADAERDWRDGGFGNDMRTHLMAQIDACREWLDGHQYGSFESLLPADVVANENVATPTKVDAKKKEFDIEGVRKMWSVDVPPEMKESVMQGQPMFLRGGAVQLTPQEVALRDAIVDLMDSYGQRVITDDVMGQSVIDYVNGEETSLSKVNKKILDTATMASEIAQANKATAISSTSGANILKKLDTLKKKLEKLSSNRSKTILGDISEALKSKDVASERRHGSSFYKTFITPKGKLITIRVSNHNATVSNFDINNEDDGISIVISNHPDKGVKNDGKAHVSEFFYSKAKLNKAYGKPLADIVGALSEAVKTGIFIDPTGIAIPHEVNADNIREMRVYHGSAADFDAFDHSHMGEGEGAQVYGWGSYVTEVKGIGKAYAQSTSSPTYKGYDRETLDSSRDLSIPHAEKIAARIMLKNLRGSLPDAIERTKRFFEKRAEIFGKRSDWTNKDFMDYFGCSRSEVREYREESQKKAQAYREYLEALNKIDESDVHQKERILYTVEIPDEAGVYYISYKDRMSDQNNILEAVDNALAAQGWKRQEIDDRIRFTNGDKQIILTPNQSGADLYAEIEEGLGSPEEASKFLHDEAGITGVKYPAQHRSGGREDGASNYVIFDENDLKITDKAKFFRTPEGEVYGFTYKGDIYIDPRVATAETPIHEYAHLWVGALKKANPKAWETLKNRMEGMSDVMEYVKGLYPELEGDDLLEEVFTHYSGKRGVERLREEQKVQTDAAEGVFNKASVIAMFEKLRGLLKDFWNKARDLFAGKVEGVEDMSGEDFADMMLGDLLGGFKPDGGGDKAKYMRDFSPRDRQIARDVYNDIVASGRYQFQEAMQDSMLGLKELYKAVLGRGTKIEDVAGNENAYLAENRMSSVNTAEQHLYFTQVMSPLLKAVYELVGEDGVARKELTDYMMAKHGLERNQKFAERDALEAKTKGKDYNGELQKNRKRDYAGLTALTGMDDVRDAEAEAQRIVDDYESGNTYDFLMGLKKLL